MILHTGGFACGEILTRSISRSSAMRSACSRGHNAELLAFFTDQANFRFADLFVEQMILGSDR